MRTELDRTNSRSEQPSVWPLAVVVLAIFFAVVSAGYHFSRQINYLLDRLLGLIWPLMGVIVVLAIVSLPLLIVVLIIRRRSTARRPR